MALLRGLVMAAKLRGEGCGAGQSFDGQPAGTAKLVPPTEAPAPGNTTTTGASADQVAAERAEKTASTVVDETAKCKDLTRIQARSLVVAETGHLLLCAVVTFTAASHTFQ